MTKLQSRTLLTASVITCASLIATCAVGDDRTGQPEWASPTALAVKLDLPEAWDPEVDGPRSRSSDPRCIVHFAKDDVYFQLPFADVLAKVGAIGELRRLLLTEIDTNVLRDKNGATHLAVLLRCDSSVRWARVRSALEACFDRGLRIDHVAFSCVGSKQGEFQLFRFDLPSARVWREGFTTRPGGREALDEVEISNSETQYIVAVNGVPAKNKPALSVTAADLKEFIALLFTKSRGDNEDPVPMEVVVKDGQIACGPVLRLLSHLRAQGRPVYLRDLAPWPPPVATEILTPPEEK